jgi:hypothetical protein
MKWYYVPLTLAAAAMAGCPSDSDIDRLFAVTDRYHDLQVADEMKRDTYVVDSPEWTALDRRIELRQQTVDNAWAQMLRDGILVSLTDATLTAKWVAGAEYRLQINYDIAATEATQALRTQLRDKNDQLVGAINEIKQLRAVVSTHPEHRK